MDEVIVLIDEAADWGVAEDSVRAATRELGFTAVNQVCLVKALQAAMADVLIHPCKGSVTLREDSDKERLRLRVVVETSGNAPADSMELDLAQRLVEDFAVSRVSGRTSVSFCISQSRRMKVPGNTPRSRLGYLPGFEAKFARMIQKDMP